jgi:DNA-binding protein HU-beta
MKVPKNQGFLSTMSWYNSRLVYFCITLIKSLIFKTSTMNKGDLINKIAADAGITKAQASAAVNSVFDSIGESLKSGDKVTLIGFGTFSVSSKEARTGRNPQTGATINIPARKSVKFKPGKELSDSVN